MLMHWSQMRSRSPRPRTMMRAGRGRAHPGPLCQPPRAIPSRRDQRRSDVANEPTSCHLNPPTTAWPDSTSPRDAVAPRAGEEKRRNTCLSQAEPACSPPRTWAAPKETGAAPAIDPVIDDVAGTQPVQGRPQPDGQVLEPRGTTQVVALGSVVGGSLQLIVSGSPAPQQRQPLPLPTPSPTACS